jgi:hypothetical protein
MMIICIEHNHRIALWCLPGMIPLQRELGGILNRNTWKQQPTCKNWRVIYSISRTSIFRIKRNLPLLSFHHHETTPHFPWQTHLSFFISYRKHLLLFSAKNLILSTWSVLSPDYWLSFIMPLDCFFDCRSPNLKIPIDWSISLWVFAPQDRNPCISGGVWINQV